MEDVQLFLSVFETSMPLLYRIITKKLHDEDIEASDSKCYVCWDVTDTFEIILAQDYFMPPTIVDSLPGLTDKFIDAISPYIDDNHLLTFKQKTVSNYWFTVITTNDKVYIIEFDECKDSRIYITINTKDNFIVWMRELLDQKMTSKFDGEYVQEMNVFIYPRKFLSIGLIGKFISKQISLLAE